MSHNRPEEEQFGHKTSHYTFPSKVKPAAMRVAVAVAALVAGVVCVSAFNLDG